MTNKYFNLINTLILTTLMATPAIVISSDEGKTLFQIKGCIVCHGKHGGCPISPNYPKLTAQNKDYLLQQMKDIKNGQRNNGMTILMRPLIKRVKDTEMEAIADYLSQPDEEIVCDQE